MNKKKIFIVGLLAAVATVIYYSMREGTPQEYIQQIEKERKEKNYFMRNNDASPFVDSVSSFTELSFFPIDAKYRVNARLVPVENKKIVTLKTSDEKEQRYAEYAHAEFSIDGVDCKLLILEVMEMGPNRGMLFLAFGDETSALESYGAGRYLDIKKVPGSTSITLDFNTAYNPYCAYNDTYSCPLPPIENLLPVAIEAGEKLYH